jgi:large conductance mechanosensitive channel
MLKEFKDFLFKGNLIEIGIAFVVGAATTAFIDSFVKNIVTPWIGLVGGGNFGNLFTVLKPGKTGGPYTTLEAAGTDGAVVLSWGSFLDQTFTFVVLMFAVFMIVKAVNKFKKAAEEAPAAPAADIVLLTEIRDALRK